jgi:hypothetical protein
MNFSYDQTIPAECDQFIRDKGEYVYLMEYLKSRHEHLLEIGCPENAVIVARYMKLVKEWQPLLMTK